MPRLASHRADRRDTLQLQASQPVSVGILRVGSSAAQAPRRSVVRGDLGYLGVHRRLTVRSDTWGPAGSLGREGSGWDATDCPTRGRPRSAAASGGMAPGGSRSTADARRDDRKLVCAVRPDVHAADAAADDRRGPGPTRGLHGDPHRLVRSASASGAVYLGRRARAHSDHGRRRVCDPDAGWTNDPRPRAGPTPGPFIRCGPEWPRAERAACRPCRLASLSPTSRGKGARAYSLGPRTGVVRASGARRWRQPLRRRAGDRPVIPTPAPTGRSRGLGRRPTASHALGCSAGPRRTTGGAWEVASGDEAPARPTSGGLGAAGSPGESSLAPSRPRPP